MLAQLWPSGLGWTKTCVPCPAVSASLPMTHIQTPFDQ